MVFESCLEGAFCDPNIRLLFLVVLPRYLVIGTFQLGARFFFATVAISIGGRENLTFFEEQMLVVLVDNTWNVKG